MLGVAVLVQGSMERVAKRRRTEAEKWIIISERMAIEGPRRPDHMVIVSVADETDDQGEPIVTVVRMKDTGKSGRKKSKLK